MFYFYFSIITTKNATKMLIIFLLFRNIFLHRNLSMNQCYFNYFIFIIILNFMFFKNLFSDFFKLYKFRLFNKNSRKSTNNVCEQWDITETKNSIKLHIFDDKELNFMFSTCCNCSCSSLYNMPLFWPWNKYKQKTNQLNAHH